LPPLLLTTAPSLPWLAAEGEKGEEGEVEEEEAET
jgi:hypothetical protein